MFIRKNPGLFAHLLVCLPQGTDTGSIWAGPIAVAITIHHCLRGYHRMRWFQFSPVTSSTWWGNLAEKNLANPGPKCAALFLLCTNVRSCELCIVMHQSIPE
jgi:hypothetical protein